MQPQPPHTPTRISTAEVCFFGEYSVAGFIVVLVGGRSCLLDQNLSPHCVKCARKCPQSSLGGILEQKQSLQPMASRPVCGADGNTYKSACHLRLAACRAGRAIPVAYKGHCKQNSDCTTIRCREGQTCLTEIKTNRPRCVTCMYRCPGAQRKHENSEKRQQFRGDDPGYPSANPQTGHSNNWAVLVCTSRFWFNYRHEANALSVYHSIKRLGIPDSQIILMLADDMACNPRNPRPATVFNNVKQHINVYADDVEVDYRGYEVTVENFVRLLTGRLHPGAPRSKQLLTDERSNIFIYLTGHGGNGFLKFQDSEEITSQDLADALEQMWQKRRYHEILFIVDTCQASSMYEKIYSPNILAIASSKVGEDSLSHHVDPDIGVYIIDRYTYYALDFLEKVEPSSSKKLSEFLKVCPKHYCLSTVGVRRDLFRRDPEKVPVTDFFGSLRPVELTDTIVTIIPTKGNRTRKTEIERKLHYTPQFPDVTLLS
ncbi:Similar to PIG-K: Putative GPI-anchor transamidase (Drosophila melanogaster) [Cotesia congregata]|uniref:Similar to PIG-K: Putative GPI-anchor transamidase (Drosophila melanogaster) n=1 Tax=Cotesia congregata TaxID=51543 RepID=A0A8J2MHL0_COTCN|nr:Similar to PIG-K: Putative GPI-anchor transamidase (Drosophila melanogaster) [Cotesia congregata]